MSEQQPIYQVVWPLGKSHWDKRDLNPGLAKKYPRVRFVEYDR